MCKDVGEPNINVVGDWLMPVLEELNKREMLIEEVKKTVNEMKSNNAPGLDGFPAEHLKKGGMAVLEWLVRMLNVSFDMRVVPIDWRRACTIYVLPLYNGKSDRSMNIVTRSVLVC